MKQFLVDGQYSELLSANGIDLKDVLHKAALPEDLFRHPVEVMDAEVYFRFIEAIGNDADTAIGLARSQGVENFAAPVYGAFCSQNGRMFLERIAKYKKLIGPLTFRLNHGPERVGVELRAIDEHLRVPAFLVLAEFAFLVHALRLATAVHIVPVAVQMREPLLGNAEEFLGIPLSRSNADQICFLGNDLDLPFRTAHMSMWDYLEPEMERRIGKLDDNPPVCSKVQGVLLDLLTAGVCDLETVAATLSMSKRTLQRRLKEEGSSFQRELEKVRQTLAVQYLQVADLSYAEISDLLGYQQTNSFLRAFSGWYGISASAFRCGRTGEHAGASSD